ncbi:MAG: ATP-dependent protease ATPase subunit HslU [Planctomycetes bacterium]|nr:ATP-dependent protease ATPase subunit HslU [Planctomycetota bacterium]
MKHLTPKAIVHYLNEYIIGQEAAKRAVAVAIRNRWRRQQLDAELQREITPKNIILIGPTGVGKTEIARRLATLVGAPFIKVEASKFTEVGYVGRDVESMVRDLVEVGINLVRAEQREEVASKARERALDRVVDHLHKFDKLDPTLPDEEKRRRLDQQSKQRAKIREKVIAGHFDEEEIEITVQESKAPMFEIFGPQGGMDQMGFDMEGLMEKFAPKKSKNVKVKVPDALAKFVEEESEKFINPDKVKREGIERTQQMGIIFLDEIDKVAVGSEGGKRSGPDVSREGVQRDLLPVVEGCTVNTKYGPVKTDHVLFIAAGAFHMSKPADLIPELQGRFPIRVELTSLTAENLLAILNETKAALPKQYEALLGSENVKLEFTPGALKRIAELAFEINSRIENIGARRLHTVMERVLEDIMFDVPGAATDFVRIDEQFVDQRLKDAVKDEDLSRYIL